MHQDWHSGSVESSSNEDSHLQNEQALHLQSGQCVSQDSAAQKFWQSEKCSASDGSVALHVPSDTKGPAATSG